MTVAGGDLTRSPVLALSVTVVGHAPAPDDLVSRSGVEAGEVVCLTGSIGGAAGGLMLIENPGLAAALGRGARRSPARAPAPTAGRGSRRAERWPQPVPRR